MKDDEVKILNQENVKQDISREEAIEIVSLLFLQVESYLHKYKAVMNIIALALATLAIVISIRFHDIKELSLYGKLLITTPTIILILSWFNLANIFYLIDDMKQESYQHKRYLLHLEKNKISQEYISELDKSVDERVMETIKTIRFGYILSFLSLAVLVISFYYFIYR